MMRELFELILCPQHGLLRPDNLMMAWGFGSQGFNIAIIWLKIKLDKAKEFWYN
jgi:hypothetical protein